jgi:hypothetical protein
VYRFVLISVATAVLALAQQEHDMSHMDMPGMQMSGGMNAANTALTNLASGTSENPPSWPMPMLMLMRGGWNYMFMGQAFLVDTQQSGPRGGDKLYSTNWGMFAASRDLGRGAVMFNAMLSLEPATIQDRRYPELFQTGETAFGRPIVDGQHPHNLIMALGIHYARPIGRTILRLYFAPVGDPALGPVAYPHRASAAELPQAPLSHHWQDSTHIADEVVTAGVSYRKVKLEASGFYGTEPGENRWTIETGPINSWSSRLWFFPARNWAVQVSVGRLARPERQEPGDVVRATASLEYTRPMQGSAWSTSLIWGRNHNTLSQRNSNAYLAESVAPYRRKNFFTGRAELVDKDELFSDDPAFETSLTRTAGSTFRIAAFTAGYTRDLASFHDVEVGLGANATGYRIPSAIQPYYGAHPLGVNVFLRVRLKPE